MIVDRHIRCRQGVGEDCYHAAYQASGMKARIGMRYHDDGCNT
jgi:hypothetical protein